MAGNLILMAFFRRFAMLSYGGQSPAQSFGTPMLFPSTCPWGFSAAMPLGA